MQSFTSKSNRWLGKTTAVGMIPVLLVPVLVLLFFLPRTLEARSESRREMQWEGLPYLFHGDYTVTIMLAEGGAVRSDAASFVDDSIHLQRITMATDLKRFPWGSDTVIARGSVKEFRVERMVGNARRQGMNLGIGGGLVLPYAFGVRTWEGWETLAHVVSGPVVGGISGYFLGRHLDRKTTIITIID